LANCTEEIFVNMLYSRVDQASDIEAIFKLRLAQEVVGNVLTVLHHASRSLLDEMRIIRHLSTAGMMLGTQGRAIIVVFDLRNLLMSISPLNLLTFDHC
jgi:hypothetical protein